MMNNMYALIGLVLAILLVVVPQVICERTPDDGTDKEINKDGAIATLYMIGTLIIVIIFAF